MPEEYTGATMLAINPKATITEQNLPKVPKLSKPTTIKAPDPAPAAAQAGSLLSPEDRPTPSMKQKLNETERPIRVAAKTL